MRETKVMTNQKGITLIALVITIIVLLILAGVAISMLSGENGILRQAAEAKTETEKASDIEMLRIASMSALTDGNGKIDTKDTTGTKKGSLKKALEENGIPTTNYKGDGLIVYNNITYVISEDGDIGKKRFSEKQYGELTNYKVDINEDGVYNDWQIFYDDGTNVYLIAKDYVEIDEATEIFNNGYYVSWREPVYPNLSTNVITKYERFNGLLTSGYSNAKSVAQLLNKTNWNEFKDTEGKAEYVIGGPTLELFSKSYNERHTSKTIEYSDKNKTYGYDVKWNSDESYSSFISGLETSDNMYVITESPDDTGKCYGYWLSSPAAYAEYSLMYVHYEAGVGASDWEDGVFCGVRPVVCLKSSSEFEKVGEVWNIK